MTSNVPKRYARPRVAVPPTRGCTLRAEWQCDLHCHLTSNVSKRYARARVAVPPTLPLGGERTGQRHPHCHLTSNVPKRYARLRVAVWVRAIHGPAGATPTLGRASSELSLERWAVSERGVPGFGPRHGGWTIRRAATPARDGPPASREIASPRPGDGGAPFPMCTGRPARAIPRLPPAAAPEEARCGPHELRYPRT